MRGCWCLGFKLADTEKRRNSIDILSPSGYDKRMPASDESKRDMLKRAGAWNAAWARVQAAVFAEHPDFCDAENLVQVKYEMLRAHHVDGLPVAEVARMFGFSRQTVYLTDAAFAIEGFGGLLTKKRGPKHPRKLTAEMVDFLTRRREQVPAISATALAEDLQQRFQATIHPRSIQRLLKKNRSATRRRVMIAQPVVFLQRGGALQDEYEQARSTALTAPQPVLVIPFGLIIIRRLGHRGANAGPWSAQVIGAALPAWCGSRDPRLDILRESIRWLLGRTPSIGEDDADSALCSGLH